MNCQKTTVLPYCNLSSKLFVDGITKDAIEREEE